MKRIMTAEVNGRCSRGRQKKRWETWYNKTWSLSDWRKKIQVAERSREEGSKWL